MYVVASWSRHGQNWLFIREVPKWWVGWLDWKNEELKNGGLGGSETA